MKSLFSFILYRNRQNRTVKRMLLIITPVFLVVMSFFFIQSQLSLAQIQSCSANLNCGLISCVQSTEPYTGSNVCQCDCSAKTSQTTVSTQTTNQTTTSQSTTHSEESCSGDINYDPVAAQRCADLAEQQGAGRGYNIDCYVEKIPYPVTDPFTGYDYMLAPRCTVNGDPGHGAELLAGMEKTPVTYPTGNTATYIYVNSGWDTLAVETTGAGFCSTKVSSCSSGPYTYEQNGQVCAAPIGSNSGNSCSSDLYCQTNVAYKSQSCFASSGGGCKCLLTGSTNDIAIGACCQPLNPYAYATPETANTLASCLGATARAIQQDNGAYYWNVPQYELVFPNGARLNAGAVARTYGNNPKAIADDMIAIDACASSATSPGLSPSGTGTGTIGTGTIANTQAYVKSLTDIVNNMTQTYKNVLNLSGTASGSSSSGTGTIGTGTIANTQAYVKSLTDIVNNMTQTYKNVLNLSGISAPLLVYSTPAPASTPPTTSACSSFEPLPGGTQILGQPTDAQVRVWSTPGGPGSTGIYTPKEVINNADGAKALASVQQPSIVFLWYPAYLTQLSAVNTGDIFSTMYVQIKSLLNVRSAPNTSAPIVKTLGNDGEWFFIASGAVTGENVNGEDRWWQLSADRYVWVGGTPEKPCSTGTVSLSTSLTSSYPKTIIVNADLLNVRSAPNTGASIVTQLSKGATFVATGIVKGQNVEGTDNWWVTQNGNYVWAGGTSEKPSSVSSTSSEFVSSISGAVTISLPTPQTSRYLKVLTPYSSGWIAWKEIEVFDATGTKLKPSAVTASNYVPFVSTGVAINTPEMAIDGRYDTVWNNGSGEFECPASGPVVVSCTTAYGEYPKMQCTGNQFASVCGFKFKNGWIQLDLGSAKTVSKVRLYAETPGPTQPRTDQILTSPDGVNYTKVFEFQYSDSFKGGSNCLNWPDEGKQQIKGSCDY